MSNEWEDFKDNDFSVLHGTGVGDEYEYKTVRRKVMTERDAFIHKASRIMVNGDVTSYEADSANLYDAGARFK